MLGTELDSEEEDMVCFQVPGSGVFCDGAGGKEGCGEGDDLMGTGVWAISHAQHWVVSSIAEEGH